MSSRCWQRRPKRTVPESDGSQRGQGELEGPEGGGLLEVRAGRWLRVCHLNPRPRDDEFRRQQETVAQYHGYGDPVVRRPQADIDQKHGRLSGNVAVHIPHAVNTRRNLHALKSNRVSPAPGDSNCQTPVGEALDFAADRGNSAGSVAFSLQSRQSYAPSPAEGAVTPLQMQLPRQRSELSDVSEEVSQNILNNALGKDSSQCKMVLFFIHGVGGSADTWRAQLDHFGALGYEIVAPDLIGHGLSMAPDQKSAYHFEEISKDVEVIFDKFCKRRNVIIGHSYGCSFAAILARKRSRRVTKLVLISGGGPTPLAPQPGVFSLPTSILACLRPCLNLSFTNSAYHRRSKVHVPRDQALDVPTYVLSHTMNGQLWADGDELFHNWLNVAALLIYGRHDQLITLAEEQTMAEAIYGSRLEVVEGASHMVMIEQPAVVNSLILNFIQT